MFFAIAIFQSNLTGEVRPIVLEPTKGYNLDDVKELDDVNIIPKPGEYINEFKIVPDKWIRICDWVTINGFSATDAIAKFTLMGIKKILEEQPKKGKILRPPINIDPGKLKGGGN